MKFDKIVVGSPTPSTLIKTAKLSNSIAFDSVIDGMLPKTKFIPAADPDAPAPVSNNFFVHPRLPGLLFKKVSSLAEIYQLGGHFAVGTRQGVTAATLANGVLVALMGRRAKAALTGTPVHVHVANQAGSTAGPLRVQTAAEEQLGTFASLTEAGLSKPAPNGQITGKPGVDMNTTAAMFYADAPDAIVPAPSLKMANIAVSNLFFDLQKHGTTEQINGMSIMAVVGEYDDGAIFTSSLNVTTPTPGQYLGCVIRRVQYGFVKTVCAAYRPTYVSATPSEFRSEADRAYGYELAVVDPTEQLSVSFGVTWETAAAGVTDVRRGYIVPRQDNEESGVSYIPYEDSPRYALPRYDVVLATDLEGKLDPLSNSMTMGFWDFHDGSLRAPQATSFFAVNRGNPYGLAELVAARASSYASAFASSTIGSAANAAGQDVLVGAIVTRVPTLDTDFRTERPYLALAGHDPHLYWPMRRLREFYRRVAKRTEDLVRAS